MYLPELHDQIHERRRGAVGLLGRAHGGLEQVLNGDLVPQGLVEQPLPRRQLAVGQDLNLSWRVEEQAAPFEEGNSSKEKRLT